MSDESIRNPVTPRGPKPQGVKQPASANVPGARRCIAKTAAGADCVTRPMSGGDRCRHHEAQHDPVLAEQVALERRMGGHLRVQLPELPRPAFSSEANILQTLESAAAAVVAGQLSPSVLNSLSQAAGVAIRLIEVRQDAEELRLTHEEAQTKRKVVLITQTPSGSESNAK